MTTRLFALASAAVMVCAGCGGTKDNPDSGANDAATIDAGQDEAEAGPAAYPADHTPFPQTDYNGGRILQNPKIVTITFSNDDPTMVSRMQQFGDIITSTAWWTAVSSEYCQQPGNKPCIGPGTGGGHVVIPDPGVTSYTDSSQGGASTIQEFIKAHGAAGADGGAADLPAPDGNTLYVLYFPTGVDITLDGSPSCNSFGAYHNTLVMPDGNNVPTTVPYAIIPRCDTQEATTTISSSHEIIEAATDPDIGLNILSYYMVSNQLWAVAGGEVGDLCEGFGSSGVTTTESTFVVQRSWSNKSAAASHNPCVPIPANEVYFNAAPRTAKVVLPKAGSTAVLDSDAFSDAPHDPWTVTAFDFAAFQQGNAVLNFVFDKSTVQNGDHIQLTITAASALPNGSDEFAIVSKDTNGHRHSWPVLASTK